MKYIKKFEGVDGLFGYNIFRPYLDNKYVILKPKNTKNYYLLQLLEEIIDIRLNAKKLYTLDDRQRVRKCKNHQFYTLSVESIRNDVIYSSSDLVEAYDVLKSIYDSKTYNL